MARAWKQEEAIAELDRLIEQSEEIDAEHPASESHVAWRFRVTDFLSEVFGEDSGYYKNFRGIAWRHVGSAVFGGPARPEESWDPQLGIDRLNREAAVAALGIARGVLIAAREKLASEPDLSALHEGKDTAPEASLLIKVINLAEHKLRKVMRDEPADEAALQDEFEKLLIGADIPYSREAERIEYSSKTYQPDFTIDKANLAIELKVCLDGGREKQLPAEINDDILAYKQKYANMLFVVYDTGNIRDVDRFADHFEQEDGVVVRVIKH